MGTKSRVTRSKYWEAKKFKSIKIDILVISMNKSGKLRMSKPCENCVLAMYKEPRVIIGNVYYSNRDSEIICVKFRDLFHEFYPHLDPYTSSSSSSDDE